MKDFQEQYNQDHRVDVIKRRVGQAISNIPHFKNRINCAAVINNDTAEQNVAAAFHFEDEAFWKSTVEKKNHTYDR